jgi:hypothetical protein
MKLKKTLSWLLGTFQRSLYPYQEECFEAPLMEQQRHLTQILEILAVERFVPKSAAHQWMERKLREREAIARSFVAKAFYRLATSRAVIRALVESPNLWRICGFERKSDIPSESTFSRAFYEFAKTDLGD